MAAARQLRTAVWALTPRVGELARIIGAELPGSGLFLSTKMAVDDNQTATFSRLKDAVAEQWKRFDGHVFIMATGIVVRTIAGHLKHKTEDPAVVVCDEAGGFAISLVSGHVGGANALAREVARITGGQSVITTATDVNRMPAIDVIAVENHLVIENPKAIKSVNMALLTGDRIAIHDPFGRVQPDLPADRIRPCAAVDFASSEPAVFVDHVHLDLPPQVLVLRPASLVVGMGCNRGTGVDEMRDLLETSLSANHLARASLRMLATVDLKADEPGLLALAEGLNIPLKTFSRDRLSQVERVPTPSAMVEKHIGVKSVCEAAALLAANRGRLIVTKQKTANVTVAIAADGYTSSVSAREGPNT